ncbi:MAG: hypothetical protein ABDH49_06855 [Candidatus Hydrothermales bacterium]
MGSRDFALRNLYTNVWPLKIENGNFVLDKVRAVERVLEATNIHERLIELLLRVPLPRVFNSLSPKKLLEFIKEQGADVKTIVDTFFSSPEFPCVIDDNVIKKAIAEGVKDGLFGLTMKDKVQRVENEVVVSIEHVTFKK